MEVPLQPLSEAEEAQLEVLLTDSSSVNLVHARGVFSAIACEPTLQDPTNWLPLILGKELDSPAALKEAFTLLLRDRFAIQECLALGEPYAPRPDNEVAVAQFCKGFVRVAHGSAVWQNDPEALALILPLAVLAGYLKLNSLRALQPDTPLDERTWAAAQSVSLPEQLQQIYAHFAPQRLRPSPAALAEKVGRNDACPCGSGKKFKKCCG